ncbi:MAG: 4-(cytidine 5'-diphospho)-2-C-methyl-D-erythritol kinase [Firmicutes bacterium]|nr:4-(cytidine 5'-diphospho)-2-C-methyl-D-erythritol kinase [Bacillota bacterium]
MDYIKLESRAKINITLDVVSKRNDGYHELEMIMQTLKLHDDIYIEKMTENKIDIRTANRYIPLDERNTAYKAAKLIKREFGIYDGVFIEITKRIPIEAGLAGGSGNGAAVLKGMNELFGLGMPFERILELAARIGSDVPFCAMEGTALAKGRGEILAPMKPCPHFFVVLAKPPEGISTAEVYKNLDLEKITEHPDTMKVVNAVENGERDSICSGLLNVLEEVTIPRLPIIGDIKKFFEVQKAKGVLMSGSGPTVFALFDEQKEAEKAAMAVKNKFLIDDVIVTETFNP